MRAALSSPRPSPRSTGRTKLTRATRTLWVVRTFAVVSNTAVASNTAVVSMTKEGRSIHAERDPGPHGDRHHQRRQAGGDQSPAARQPQRGAGGPAHQHQ